MNTKAITLASAVMMVGVYGAFANCGSCGEQAGTEKGKECPAGVCAVSPQGEHAATGKAVSPKIGVPELATLLKSGVPLTVVDARTGKWDDGRRVTGAKNLHAGSDVKDITSALPDKKGLIITYCSNVKCGASAALAKRLKELGYENIIEFPEGIEGWAAAGQSVEKTDKK